MNNRQLQYILEIAKERNITTAAANLYISQPSLSSLLASVEKEVGAQLFDRNSSPMNLTEAGEIYIETARSILNSLDTMQKRINDLTESLHGRLRLGCTTHQSPLLIPVVLAAITERYPEIQIMLTEDSPAMLEKLLLSGELDLYFSVGNRKLHPRLTTAILIQEEVMMFAPASRELPTLEPSPARRFPVIDFSKLGNEPFVLMKEGHQLRRIMDTVFEENDFRPNVILETSSWQTCLRMVTNKIASTLLPYIATEAPACRMSAYCLNKEYYWQSSLYYRKNAYFSKIMHAFISTAKEVLQGTGNKSIQ